MGCGTVFFTAILGLIFFGPPGAIIGAFIGFVINSSSSNNSNYYDQRQNRGQRQQTGNSQLYFYEQLFGMLAKLAQADGAVSRTEINIIDRFTDRELNLPSGLKREVIKLFDKAKRDNMSFESYARNFYKIIGNQPHVLGRVMELMDQLANADGGRSSKQSELLKKAMNIFNLNRNSYQNNKRTANNDNISGNKTKDPYEILDCSRNDSTKEIKKKYRKLVKEYHPDRIISKDLPDEFVELANKRFKEIQDAYEKIMKMRGEK